MLYDTKQFTPPYQGDPDDWSYGDTRHGANVPWGVRRGGATGPAEREEIVTDGGEDMGLVECPECGEYATEAKPEVQDEPAISFVVDSDGEIVSAKTETLVRYTLRPCGHSFYGTYDPNEVVTDGGADHCSVDADQSCWSFGCNRRPVTEVVGRADNPVSVCEEHEKELVEDGECQHVDSRNGNGGQR